jgi:hypothetical protein
LDNGFERGIECDQNRNSRINVKTSKVASAVPLVWLMSFLMRQTVTGEAQLVNPFSLLAPLAALRLSVAGLAARFALLRRTGRRVRLQLASPVAPWPVRLTTTHIANNPCLSRRRDRYPSTSVDC